MLDDLERNLVVRFPVELRDGPQNGWLWAFGPSIFEATERLIGQGDLPPFGDVGGLGLFPSPLIPERLEVVAQILKEHGPLCHLGKQS